MAGAGFKTFNTGDVLTASDVNTYLMQQTVMVFDDASARNTALGANVAEGMMSYLKDTNKTYRYDGSSWLDDAGTTSPLTTKGDLWTYSTTDARLAVGTDGYTLVADSSETTGLKWQAPAGGGKVLQVVQMTTSTLTSIATSTYTDSGLTLNITPSAATSKVLVIADCNVQSSRSGSSLNAYARIMRDATSVYDTHILEFSINTASTISIGSHNTLVYLDSPSTTSAITYKVQGSASLSSTLRFQYTSNPSSLTLIEIGA